ncbi:ribonuclease H [Tanacetum coccineum]|uniref:Ribonuclease H n=1 Tax=Tanacetum coccineum TaxID=301880 RepID=A0ABQ5EQX6_9ASTR
MLNQRQGEGWICFGDFNEILYAFEKLRGRGCNTNEMVAFRHACNMCNLEDMDSTGVKFTWSNGQQGCDNVKKRLDRFLANADCCRLYPNALFQNLARISSDHSPIICHFSPRVRKTEKMFRFESMWLRDESFHDVVRDAWTSGLARGRQSDPCSIVEEFSARISEWNKNSFGCVQKLIKSKQKRLQMLQSYFDSSTGGEQDILKEEIKELLTREEIFRNKRNSILRLKDEDGRWVENADDICNLVSAYFSNLFSSSSPQDYDSVVEAIDQSLTGDDILSLEKHVTTEEVYDALMQMAPTKAPGPDGFGEPNKTNFASYCSRKSICVSNRVITDNAIVAFEVMHWLKNKKDGKRGALTLKIDMSKAYDRVEWHFIRAVLGKFRFPTRFTNLIMACVSSVSYSFNINEKIAGHVTLARGLRQGDPISPYLFIMCTEVLSSMIRKLVTQGRIHGVKVCRGASAISHLFFADDNISFLRASSADVINLKNILVRYCRSSGQIINYEKLEVSFSANVEPHVRTHIIESLEVREVTVQSKYLGFPSVIDESKKVVFRAIIDKIKKKLQGWKEKTISIGGKEVLIKSVAQAMPMYVMNIFLLPDTLIDDIHIALNYFWSLLAKQVWRLITNPTTLAAKVLKARLFHDLVSLMQMLATVQAMFGVALYRPGGLFSSKSAYYLELESSQHIVQNVSEKSTTLFRAIWNAKGLLTRRNKKFHGQVDEKDANVEVMSKLLLMDYHKANPQQLTTTRTKTTVKWTKPNGDYIKFNCDASWQKESGRAGFGFVA